MLAIRTHSGNQYFDLGDTSVNFSFSNPLFDEDGLPKAVTLPFRLPRTPKNESLLNHSARFDAEPNDLAVEIRLAGVPFYVGVLTVESVSDLAFEVSFRSQSLDAAQALSSDWLDLNYYDTQTIVQDNKAKYYLRIVTNGIGGASVLSMTIGGHTYTHTVTAPSDIYLFRDSINTHHPGAASITGSDMEVNFDSGNINLGFAFSLTNGAGYVWLVLSSSYNRAQAIIDNFIEHLNTNAASGVSSMTHFFPSIRFPAFYEGNALFTATPILNFHNGGSFDGSKNTDQVNNHDWDYAFLPWMKVFKLIAHRLNSYKYHLNDDTGILADDEIKERVIWSLAKAIDRVIQDYGFDAPAYATGVPEQRYYNVHAESAYNLLNNMPHVTTWQLCQSIMAMFGIVWLEEQDGITFITRAELLAYSEVLDWTSYAEPAFNANKRAEADGYTLVYSDLDKDVSQAGFLKARKVGNGEKKNAVEIGPCAEVNELTYGPARWIIPYTDRPGNGDDRYKGFVMLYRGMTPNSIGDDYPFASNNNLDVNGDTVGDHTLAWDNNQTDLYTEYWQEFTEFMMSARKCQKVLRLSPKQLLKARNWRSARRRIYHDDGVLDAYIAQIQFTATANDIGLAKVEFYFNP
jgi:hypothetical protein